MKGEVEPVAMELLERYRGESGLLCIRDRYRSARDYTQHINAGLKRVDDLNRQMLELIFDA